jgi:predicted Ser/Thr protein kinase
MDYDGKPALVKALLIYPQYFFPKFIIENRFENEIIFSIYAKELNQKCAFVSPEIYAYGSILIDCEEGEQMECLFLIMEFIEGISLEHVEFTPEVCTKMYEIKRKLTCELLSHNDLYARNMMIDPSNNIIVLDYGESSCCV